MTSHCVEPGFGRDIEAVPRAAFPFSALVGQPVVQLALLLAAIDPGIGGVLICGPRGTAKSTAARALAALVPPTSAALPAPFVTLPLSATVEQLVGTLNVEDVLRDGRLRLAPGVLSRAHEGVLYVDEVNLLPDALVDALLDVAASGVNTVERDGISCQHAARFVLVGTMNPEEGALRPQLLDRFGLSVLLANPTNADLRVAIMRARLNFDETPHALAGLHAPEQARLVAAVATARTGLAGLAWSDAVLRHVATVALDSDVDGMRADLVILRAARALTAFDGRSEVTVQDVDAVAELALAHRRGESARVSCPPAPPPPAPSAEAAALSAPAGQKIETPPAEALTPSRPPAQPPTESLSQASPSGDWGRLPPRAETTTRVSSVGGWPLKKA